MAITAGCRTRRRRAKQKGQVAPREERSSHALGLCALLGGRPKLASNGAGQGPLESDKAQVRIRGVQRAARTGAQSIWPPARGGQCHARAKLKRSVFNQVVQKYAFQGLRIDKTEDREAASKSRGLR